MAKPNHFVSLMQTSQIKRKNGTTYTIRANRMRYFFPDEWAEFFDKLKPRQKVTFNFLINTGARINEVKNIKVSDVDIERQSILLRQTKTRNKDGSRKIRIITISSQFVKYIQKIIREYELKPDNFFPVLSTPPANIAMKKALQEAGIKDYMMFSVHNVRKTLETWLIALDVDSLKIVKHFGHTLQIASEHYVSPDTFSWDDKKFIRQIIGDLYERRY